MNAAAHIDACHPSSPSAVSSPLPRSNAAVQPDRGDWEFLMTAVGHMRMRPMSAPFCGLGESGYESVVAILTGAEPTSARPGT